MSAKVTFIGDSNAGKSSLIHRFSRDEFSDTSGSTIGAAFVVLTHNTKKYHIWDTAGQERYNSLIPLYLRGTDVVVIVYDISCRNSFERVMDHWFSFVKKNLTEQPFMVLLGNKYDLHSKRVTSVTEAQLFADEHNMIFFEVSAKTSHNISKVFHVIDKHIIEKEEMEKDDSIVDLQQDEYWSGWCCSGSRLTGISEWW